ncbi:MAG: class IV adenylate cyclase [Candidatus Saccharibacteria bacterium]|nr:MAG: class IV adenylate cyclase [Candidatus Saccharibacteria bacterium]
MKTEIEVKFLGVDFDKLRQSLARQNADLEQPMRLMRRVIIETPELAAQNSFIRVRDEGNKVTLTYKRFDEHSLTGAKEIELTVNSFNDTIALLEQVGLAHKSFQESRRETWRLDDVEIVLDEWPWLDPYVEIEGESEARVREVAALLGFNWEDAVFGSATSAYQVQYPDGDASQLVNIPLVAFDQPLPAIISGEGKEQ